MKKPETTLQRKIVEELSRKVGGHWVKIHGSQFQTKGIPDLLGCVAGLFFALEVKCDSSQYGASDYQLYNIKQIHESGGMAAVVESPEEAVALVNRHIKERALSAEERSKLIDDTIAKLEEELRDPNNKPDQNLAPVHRRDNRVIIVPKEVKSDDVTESEAKKTKKKSTSNTDKLTLAELADQVGVEAKIIRRQLRKLYPNHKGSWSWEGEDEIADIMGVVQSWS